MKKILIRKWLKWPTLASPLLSVRANDLDWYSIYVVQGGVIAAVTQL